MEKEETLLCILIAPAPQRYSIAAARDLALFRLAGSPLFFSWQAAWVIIPALYRCSL